MFKHLLHFISSLFYTWEKKKYIYYILQVTLKRGIVCLRPSFLLSPCLLSFFRHYHFNGSNWTFWLLDHLSFQSNLGSKLIKMTALLNVILSEVIWWRCIWSDFNLWQYGPTPKSHSTWINKRLLWIPSMKWCQLDIMCERLWGTGPAERGRLWPY